MLYYAMKALSWLLCVLPDAAGRLLGQGIGELTWFLVPKKRKQMALANVQLCLQLSEEAATAVVRKSWTRFGTMVTEVLRFPVIRKNMEHYIEVRGIENLKQAQSFGHGGIIATAHSGNWELLGGALAHLGLPVVGVAQKQKNPAFDRLINEYRTLIGMQIMYKSGVKDMFVKLGEGFFIGLLMDQDAGRDGILLDFFGRETSCVQGPASMARYKEAPILPVFISQAEDGHHILHIHPPFFVEKSSDKKADIAQTTERLNRLIEEHIRSYPEEWFWMHDRWKSVSGKKRKG